MEQRYNVNQQRFMAGLLQFWFSLMIQPAPKPNRITYDRTANSEQKEVDF